MPPAPKKTAFEKTQEILGLPGDREYPESQQELYNTLVKASLSGQTGEKWRSEIVEMITEGGLSKKQVEAAIAYAKKHIEEEVTKDAIREASGVGVVYTDEQIIAAVKDQIEKHHDDLLKRRYRFPVGMIIGPCLKALPWVDGEKLKKTIDTTISGILGPRTEADEVPVSQQKSKPVLSQTSAPQSEVTSGISTPNQPEEEGTVPEGLRVTSPLAGLPDLSNVASAADKLVDLWGPVPAENRYTQRPDIAREHEAFTGGHPLTRFPPEPNGYLHLGHAKSMFLNFGYAATHGGRTYLRYDDTNPDKENQEYIDNILENVKWLGHSPWKVTYTSDYFDRLYEIAVDFIRRGLCYVDNQQPEELAQYRHDKRDPPCRNRPVEESLRLFEEMRLGLHEENSLTLRLRMDMQSPNPCMRDPIAYRIRYSRHPRTGDKWCIYPSYDFSHCLIDSFENITHSMCTLEFEVRRESYDWVTQHANGYLPMQWEFSRLNVTHNVMSKRRLLRLVQEGWVSGWDDPNLLTLAGLRRRGYTPSIINNFIARVGFSRSDQLIETSLLEQCARIEFDAKCDRTMCAEEPLLVRIVDWNKEDEKKTVFVVHHPKIPERGTSEIPWTRDLYISRADFLDQEVRKDVKLSNFYRLAQTQGVGLRYGPNIFVQKVIRDDSGNVIRLDCTHDWERKKKCKAQIQWVPASDSVECEIRIFNNLFVDKNPYKAECEDWIESLNPERRVIHRGRVTKELANAPVNSRYQFERLGFFIKDRDSVIPSHPVFVRIIPLRDSTGGI